MANVLNINKKIAIIGALTEGSSIRSVERMTGVHRDTTISPKTAVQAAIMQEYKANARPQA